MSDKPKRPLRILSLMAGCVLLLAPFAAAQTSIAPQDKPKLPSQEKPTMRSAKTDDASSWKSSSLRRGSVSDSDYTKAYKETYQNYAEEYRNNYRNNPILWTGDDDDEKTAPAIPPVNIPDPAAREPRVPAVPPQLELPPIIREVRFYRPPIQLNPYMVQKVLQERAKASHQTAETAPAKKEDPQPASQQASTARVRSASEILLDQALQSFQQRNYYHAVRSLGRLWTIEQDDAMATYAYGVALFASRRYEKAAQLIPQGMQLAEEKNITLPGFEEIYSRKRDYQGHYNQFARYLKQRPQSVPLTELFMLLPSELPGE